MSITFNLAKIPQIFFGAGKILNLEKQIRQFGKNCLILTGKSSFFENEKGIKIKEKLEESGIICHYVSVENEPSPKLVDSVCNELKNRIDVVIGIGGGSVLDAGKAISAMLKAEGSVRDFLEGVGTKTHSGQKIPYIAIPTTSGTGSETTSNAVISEIGMNGFKKSLRHPDFVPDIAIVDPELTLSCSKALTASTGMDAFSQLLESYLSVKSSSLTDALAIEGLKQISSSLVKAYNNGSDLESRSSMAYASMLSGITLTNAGLGLVHGFASPIGGFFNIPHGVVCGTLMAACNDYTIRKLRKENQNFNSLYKYAKVGELFSKDTNKSNDYYIDLLIEKLYELTNFLSISKSYKATGLFLLSV